MASKVELVVEAKDSASGILRGIANQMGQFGSVIEQVTGTSINWGNVAAASADMIYNSVKKSIDVTREYAAEVRDLSLVADISAKEASALIDTLGEYEITVQDITAATRNLTKNGLSPNIDTIADLADQYVKLNTAQEKNQFILDNLGRSGLGWANALSQGGDALREFAVNQSLILTDENIRQAEEYRIALDAWNDVFTAMQINVGTQLLPVMTQLMEGMVLYTDLAKNEEESYARAAVYRNAVETAIRKETEAINNAYSARMDGIASLYQLGDATKTAAEAAANSVPDYTKQLSVIQKLTDATQEQIKAVAYQQLQQQLAEDGITEEEAKLLQDAGLALGIFDENAVNAAESIAYLNKQLAAGNIALQTYTSLLNNIPTEINTTLTTTTSGTTASLPGGTGYGYQQGGEVYAGSPVMVGERGREPFMPAQDGRILGHAESLHALSMGSGGGTNYFYGNVTLQIDETMGNGILEYR